MSWHCIIIAATTAILATAGHAETISGQIDHIVDGDTFAFAGLTIRLCGIDAPERGEPGYASARQSLVDLIGVSTVRCVPAGAGSVCDKRSKPVNRQRVVAQCFARDIDLAAEQVRRGHACDWPAFSGGAYRGGCSR